MTFSLVLAQAAETAQSGFAAQAEHFGIEPKYIAMQAVSFLILFAVLYYYGIKPVIATMGERQEKISAGLKHAEEMRLKLEETNKLTQASIHEAQVKGQKLIEDAQKSAKEFSDKQQQEAVEKANALITKAQAAIELEKKKMLAEARTEIARLVVATTSRVLARELSDADRSKYNDAAARELTQV
jgi:F-type H+-transporting ATPase subunit b